MTDPEIQRILNELEPRVVDRLQEHKKGQKVEGLAKTLKVNQSFILSVLYMLKAQGYATVSKGVWKLKLHVLD
jgi:hypothetical protein